MILLDSSAVIELLDASERGARVSKLLESEEAGVSAITAYEVLFGESGVREETALNLFASLRVFPVDFLVALKSSKLQKILAHKGLLMTKFDVLIASTALVHDLFLLTFDKDFDRVGGLKVVHP